MGLWSGGRQWVGVGGPGGREVGSLGVVGVRVHWVVGWWSKEWWGLQGVMGVGSLG